MVSEPEPTGPQQRHEVIVWAYEEIARRAGYRAHAPETAGRVDLTGDTSWLHEEAEATPPSSPERTSPGALVLARRH